jgi:hypothetical protein
LNYRDKFIITDQIKDSFDMAGLKVINDKYFNHYPINLLELMSGDKYNKSTTHILLQRKD